MHNSDGTSCPTWVMNARNKLPRENTSTTSGYVFTPDGKQLWDGLVESGRSDLTKDISDFLKQSDDFPNLPGYNSLAHHAEAKTAWAMANQGAKGDVLHVVINKNYLCPKVTNAVQLGCKQTVPAILYEDQTLCVWLPGSNKGIPLDGKRKRKGSTWTKPEGDRCAVQRRG
ncbi:DddA-like double-stranded DNA deaminase toxin [Streptomyces sp. NPDC051771]|uniref:DddA-like double-stranded DNA deaminase toxin n=1 Tax=Streptomyces sp. NPDC051771 TaxID=3154847 RepID=UPI00342097B6